MEKEDILIVTNTAIPSIWTILTGALVLVTIIGGVAVDEIGLRRRTVTDTIDLRGVLGVIEMIVAMPENETGIDMTTVELVVEMDVGERPVLEGTRVDLAVHS